MDKRSRKRWTLVAAMIGFEHHGEEWIVNTYLLSLSALMLLGGSLACGLAPTGGALIASRLVQGAAAALVTPSTLALLI